MPIIPSAPIAVLIPDYSNILTDDSYVSHYDNELFTGLLDEAPADIGGVIVFHPFGAPGVGNPSIRSWDTLAEDGETRAHQVGLSYLRWASDCQRTLGKWPMTYMGQVHLSADDDYWQQQIISGDVVDTVRRLTRYIPHRGGLIIDGSSSLGPSASITSLLLLELLKQRHPFLLSEARAAANGYLSDHGAASLSTLSVAKGVSSGTWDASSKGQIVFLSQTINNDLASPVDPGSQASNQDYLSNCIALLARGFNLAVPYHVETPWVPSWWADILVEAEGA